MDSRALQGDSSAHSSSATIIRNRVARWASLSDLVADTGPATRRHSRAVSERLDYIKEVHDIVVARVEAALSQLARSRPSIPRAPK
jgi:hypothetical protein